MADTDEIKSRLDVVEIVSERVQLQRAGRNYKANCPFHSERTPSFIVDPARQSWRCFGQCGIGGDVFSFLMKIDQIDFGDALQILARRAGVEVTYSDQSPDRDDYFRINQIATNFYTELLSSDKAISARKYLDDRGLGDNVRNDFQIGYSPKDRDSLKKHLIFHDIDLSKAVDCGLLIKADNGAIRDFFWDRIMFPIHNRSGDVAGFGARALGDAMPKYINTPATSIFDKRRILYGFHKARDVIRNVDEGVIVEGYMDVIAAHEHGYKNVVASMGTALTPEQVRQLKNIASSYVLALDQDEAGQEATLRSLESSWRLFDEKPRRDNNGLFASNPIKLKVLSLSDGKDPDEFIRSENGDWDKAISEALPVMEYVIPVVSRRFDLRIPGSKTKVVNALAPLFRTMDPFDRDRYLRTLSDELNATLETVREALRIAPKRTSSSDENVSAVQKTHSSNDIETKLDRDTLALLFAHPNLRFSTPEINPEYFLMPEDRELLQLWKDTELDDESTFADKLNEFLRERYIVITNSKLVPMSVSEAEKDLKYLFNRLERRLNLVQRESFVSSKESDYPPTEEENSFLADIDMKIRRPF